MKIYASAPSEDPRQAPFVYRHLEEIGYDAAFSFETKHDPFLTLAVAAEHTREMRLGTGVAIAFARNPMNLANLGYDMQSISGGRFIMGLGSQIRPHIEKRFSCTWSHPAERMRELVMAIRAIWNCWETGGPLNFEGRFYTHTLMTPAFDPGPNPCGLPPIFTGGFGSLMTTVSGEVADGFISHTFSTRRSLMENTLPALHEGLSRSGRERSELEVMCSTLVVTADNEEQYAAARRAACRQISFHGSTPAYAPTLACHGWEALQPELNRLSKQGRWEEMADLIDDDILQEIAVVGEPRDIPGKLRSRLEGIANSVSIVFNNGATSELLASVVEDFKRLN